MDRSIVDLRTMSTLLNMYKHIRDNGFDLKVGDKTVLHKSNQKLDEEDKATIERMIRANKEKLFDLLADTEGAKAVLISIQKKMIAGQRYVNENFHLWDIFEQAYRYANPNDTECINGEPGCPEDSLVSCKACEVRHD